MADIKINGATPSGFYYGSTAATAVYYGSTKLWPASSPTPSLPANTIRCKFTAGYTPTMGTTQTLVDATENIWDIYKAGTYWASLFGSIPSLQSVIAANTTGVTSMDSMFYYCTGLTTVPLFDTSSATNLSGMFRDCQALTSIPLFNTSSATNTSRMFLNCYAVESGSLALYTQASAQVYPPSTHEYMFTGCGRDTVTGAAELAQIPASWGGTGA